MSKTATFILGSLLGLLLGGVLTFYFFVGAPRAAKPPGVPIQAPDAGGTPPGTAQIVLRQEFFNQVLQTIFRDTAAPSFPLSLTENRAPENTGATRYGLLQNNQCESKITLLPEGSGVQTSLKFDQNRIVAPLAFRGSYNSAFGCLNFSGWAQANLGLYFDANQQAVFGQLNIETVNLDGITPLLSGIVTPIVQGTLNQRVNPIQILQGRQIALSLPIAATESQLQARVQDVRSEIKDNALNLYVIYEFAGGPATQ